jgi:hypothetical protein
MNTVGDIPSVVQERQTSTLETRKYQIFQVSGKNYCYYVAYKKVKSKAVPLHAMEALGGRGDIAPTHS